MSTTLTANSIWIDGAGRRAANPSEDRGHAMDHLGWINIRASAACIEFWVNPFSVQEKTLATAIEFAADFQSAGSQPPVVVRIHDRGSCGSVVAGAVDSVPDAIRDSVSMTSRPGHPLVQDRLTGCLPTDINDPHVRDMWRFLVASRFTASGELVDRVISTEGRAKVVTIDAGGDIRYLAHDRRTAALWKHPPGFAGRRLDDIPMPAPLKRSVRSDLTGMLQERQIVVSFVRGLRRVMPDEAPMDSYFRVSIPLRRDAVAASRAAVVLLAPYA